MWLDGDARPIRTLNGSADARRQWNTGEDLDIEVQGDLLVIEGRKRLERERRGGRYRLMQCSYGSFRRALQLPASVHADKASASYRDGVLRIELPKREPLHTHRIAVKAA